MRRARTAIRRKLGGGGLLALSLVALGPLAGAAAEQERPRGFLLLNEGPDVIIAVEISPAGDGRYGPSLIGRVELPPGSALHVTPPAGSACLNDLRIRFRDGGVVERTRENLCRPQRELRVGSPPA